MGDTEQEKLIILDITGVQRYLNDKYGANSEWNELDEDGVAGYNTMVGLVRALQIEMGIDADGGFGNGTKNTFNNLFPNGLGVNTEVNTQQIKNIIALINSGLMCRIEISNNSEDAYVYSNNTTQGIKNMMNQLGISDFTNNITARQVKAVMTSDAYYLISNGDETTRQIQQSINRKYSDVLDNYIPTNGLYERNMNTAIIKAIQYEIGVDVDGGWGEGTKSALPILGPGSSRTKLVYILQYLLYLNGFDPNGFDGGFGNGVTTALKNFQSLMKLDSDGYCGRQAWSALVVSCGDTARSANACDTCFEITQARAQLLKNNGYNIVGRYLTGYISETRPKALQDGELEVIFNAGLGVFLIYQENNRKISDFSYDKGVIAAIEACTAARQKNVPKDTIIYFAVDLDIYEEQIDNYIIPFFRGINAFINFRYKVGIYGPRLVCQRVSDYGFAESSFVADMSSGYSCNVGTKMPNNWDYDQFKEISNYRNELDIDKVTYRGRVNPLDHLEAGSTEIESANKIAINYLEEVYNIAKDYYMLNYTEFNVAEVNALALQYLAYIEYFSTSWCILANYDTNAITYISSRMENDRRQSVTIYSKDYEKSITLPHLAISTYMILARTMGLLPFDSIISDLTGWAGDLLSFASDFADMKLGEIPSNLDDQIANVIGSDSSSNFSKEDFIQDLDAWNLYKNLNYAPLHHVIDAYYNAESTNRAAKFINNRMELVSASDEINANSPNLTKVYAFAKKYLTEDMSQISYWTSLGFDNLLDYQMPIREVQDKIAMGFAKKVVQTLDI